jgi:hypothetical protein
LGVVSTLEFFGSKARPDPGWVDDNDEDDPPAELGVFGDR